MGVSAALILFLQPVQLNGEEIFEEAQIVSDSLDTFLDDMRGYIDESILDSIKTIYRSKGEISYRKILEISGDEYAAEMISNRLISRKEAGLKFEAGAFRSILTEPDTKTFMFGDGYISGHEVFALAEKDASEELIYDNWKAGYSWNSLLAGDFRIKTGRGIFSDWSSYFSPLSVPFSSDRVELDRTYNEYPSCRGAAYSTGFAGMKLTMAAAYNLYDASLSDSGQVRRVLSYNLHDDSLSISRGDNLSEMYACGILRIRGGLPKIAFSYSRYSREFEESGADWNSVIDLFGRNGPISYDIGMSGNKGFAFSAEAKREFENILLKSGVSGSRGFFNIHSRPFMDRDNFIDFHIYAHFRKPFISSVSICHSTDESSRTDADIELSLNKNADMSVSISRKTGNDVDASAKFTFKASGGRFFLKNSIKFTDSGSGLARVNVTYASDYIRVNGYAYIYEIEEGDIFSEYEYVNSGVFPMRVLGAGSGFAAGISSSVKLKENAEFSAALSYGSGGRISGGATLSVFAGY